MANDPSYQLFLAIGAIFIDRIDLVVARYATRNEIAHSRGSIPIYQKQNFSPDFLCLTLEYRKKTAF